MSHRYFNQEGEESIMPTMRTITQAVELYRGKDPGTVITVSTLHRWVKEGKVQYVKSGNTHLVNMESLEAFLVGKE